MEDIVANLDETRAKVTDYLHLCIGEFQTSPSGEMWFPFGSTRLAITTRADETGNRTLVHIGALVASNVPVSDELFRWLADASGSFLFGHLTCSADGGDDAILAIEHTLLGDYLDLEELRVALAAVASSADQLDDVVVSRFGGLRYSDLDLGHGDR
jgi:hypothetical protein